jgi:hypothetical protein
MSKLKTYLPWLACLLLIAGGLAYDYAPPLSSLELPNVTDWFSLAPRTPAAWVVIVRDEATQTHEQAEAWTSPAARKVMSDAKVQFRLLDAKQRENMPQAFWPWLDRAAAMKAEQGGILMADESGKILDAAAAPKTEAEFLNLLKSKGRLP